MAKCKLCGRWERDQSEWAVRENLGKDEWQVTLTINPDKDNMPPLIVVKVIPKNSSLKEIHKTITWMFDFIEARAKDFENPISSK